MNDKIILVNPPSSMYDIERFLPLGLLAVGSCIKNKYKNIHIEDLDNSLRYSLKQNEKLNYQALAEYIVVQNPSIVGFTAFCNNLPVALYLAKLIKKQNNRIKILFGGPQPSMVASELIKYFDFVDVICRKETETFIVDLIDKILSNNNIHSVPGITFKEGSTIVENPIPVLIENLDDLPYLDFSLIDPSNYDVLKHPLEIGVEAGRGCPFHCDFCSTSLMWSKKHRVKSVQRLFEEMKTVSQFFNVDSIALIHDNFTVNNKYISDFCKLLLENESSIKWRCSSRADHLDDQLIDLMSQAHCKELFFGIETGSQRLQNKIHKRLNLDTANKTINSV
ncbi:B12-binding domain-containing radical SAM protein, partial [bacterium]|nr:B12-binding domain-containing radical SAM protein [bacterium]MBU1918494.1 B12-binding domain-containing radical SAM protein [bacterium]